MPARVEFHTGVADPVRAACLLLRKAYRKGARVLVTAPPQTLAALDTALWTFDAQDFVPHVRVPGPDAALADRTPIWLAAAVPERSRPPVLINLDAEPPADPEAFERIIELVAADDAAREAGRARWRHYLGWGVSPVHHGGAD